jgi:protein-disulfide isomerase
LTRFFATLAAVAFFLTALPTLAGPPSAEAALKDRVLGDPNAPIEIIEYSSLTCPHCRHFHTEILPELKKNYLDTGRAKLIYRDFPFDQLGLMASVLARCAPPSRYFQFLDVLFQNQDKWSRDSDPVMALARIGKLGGLGEADFRACADNKSIIDGVLQTRLDAGKRFEVNSTPSFIINGEKRIVGSQPYEVFDDLLKKLEK